MSKAFDAGLQGSAREPLLNWLRNIIAAHIFFLGCAAFSAKQGVAAADRPLGPNEAMTDDEVLLTPGVLLGKRLFDDTDLSEPRGLACSSCHNPKTAYRGNNHSPIAAIAAGSRPNLLGTRKTPSILYMSYSPPFSFAQRTNDITGLPEIVPVGGQFWDGRARDLQEQFEGPLLNPREMNNPSKQSVVDKVRNAKYAPLVRAVFGPDIFDDPRVFEKLASAVDSFEASARFKPFSSKFDDWLEGKLLLSDQEWLGFQLFIDKQKGNCLSCHDGGGADVSESSAAKSVAPGSAAALSRNPKSWLFTDFTYDVLGAPRNMQIPENAAPSYADLGLCKRPELERFAPRGFDIESLCGAFKVPSLRNVAVSSPYMHNGVFTTLREAVAFYFTRDTNPERWYPKASDGTIAKYNDLPEKYRPNVNVRQVPYDRKPGEYPRATDTEIDAITAFLGTLTDRQFVSAEPSQRGAGARGDP